MTAAGRAVFDRLVREIVAGLVVLRHPCRHNARSDPPRRVALTNKLGAAARRGNR